MRAITNPGLATDMPQTEIYGEYTIMIVGPNETEDTGGKDSKPSSTGTTSLYSSAATYVPEGDLVLRLVS
jgi:hypothetical protein